MKINQITNAISQYDAISNQVLEVKNVLHNLGHTSKIYVKYKDPNLKDSSIIMLNKKHNDSTNISQQKDSIFQSDIIILHHYNKSLVLDIFKQPNCKKVLYYHNITPPIFFSKYDKELKEKSRNWSYSTIFSKKYL